LFNRQKKLQPINLLFFTAAKHPQPDRYTTVAGKISLYNLINLIGGTEAWKNSLPHNPKRRRIIDVLLGSISV